MKMKELALAPGTIYLGGRAYAPVAPQYEMRPEALTEEKGERIAKYRGRELSIVFEETDHEGRTYSSGTFASCRTVLRDIAKRPAGDTEDTLVRVLKEAGCTVTSPTPRSFDYIYQFMFEVKTEECLQKIMTRKDRHYSSEDAFERAVAHWGDTPWSHLVLQLEAGSMRLLRTKVDVFAPRTGKLAPALAVGLYSHFPDYKK